MRYLLGLLCSLCITLTSACTAKTLPKTQEPPRPNAVFEAVTQNNLDELRTLIAIHADLNNVQPGMLEAPLHIAAANGYDDALALLIDASANMSALDANERSLAHYAARGGQAKIINILAINNADLAAFDKFGDTPLHVAAAAGHDEVVLSLIRRGVLVNAKNFQAENPLMHATRMKHKRTVKILLKYGASPTQLSLSGESALSIAEKLQAADLMKLLSRGPSLSFWDHIRFYFRWLQ